MAKSIKKMRLKHFKGLLFILPSIVGTMLFYIIPFISSIKYCFTIGVKANKFVGLDNFIKLFSNQKYCLAVLNTLFIIGIALPSLCVLAVCFSLLIEKQLKRFKWIQGILLIPMAVPAASLSLMWKDFFAVDGIVNTLFNMHVNWLESNFAALIIICIIIWKNLGYVMLLIISHLLTMPKEYEEAATVDGAGYFKIALYIKIPYLVPTLFFSVIISIVNCLKIFRDIYLLQGNYPYEKLYLLQHFMNNHFMKLNYELLAAAAFVLYILLFIIIYIFMKLQQEYINNNT